jgi:hypothetical protein
MKKLLSLILTFNFIPLFYCSSTSKCLNNSENDNTPFKQIYVCPLPEIVIDSSINNFYEKKLNASVEKIQDSVSKYFNIQYDTLTRKCLLPKKAVLCNSDPNIDFSKIDRCYLNEIKITNKYYSSKVSFIKYPDKRFLDSVGMNCDYGLFLSEITLFTITTSPPKSNCHICDLITLRIAHVPMVNAAIKGKYIFWDYGNNKEVSAGEFRSPFKTIGLDDRENINKTVYPIVAEILYRSPFWKIRNLYYESN